MLNKVVLEKNYLQDECVFYFYALCAVLGKRSEPTSEFENSPNPLIPEFKIPPIPGFILKSHQS